MNRIFDKFNQLADSANVQNGTLRSKNWFMRLASNENQINSINKVTDKLKTPSRLKPGMMITYTYTPKYAEKLSYYDTHPLVLITEINRTGWVGMNVHYMHPKQRAHMFYRHQKNGMPFMDESLTKRYLSNHVLGPVKEIPKEQWEIAIQLPYESFRKVSKEKVWKMTKKVKK